MISSVRVVLLGASGINILQSARLATMSKEGSYVDARKRCIDENKKRMDALNIKFFKNKLNEKPLMKVKKCEGG